MEEFESEKLKHYLRENLFYNKFITQHYFRYFKTEHNYCFPNNTSLSFRINDKILQTQNYRNTSLYKLLYEYYSIYHTLDFNLHLSNVDEIISNIPRSYKYKFINNCRINNTKKLRIEALNIEISKIDKIKNVILNDVVFNLNFCKKRKDSHYQNPDLKLKGYNVANYPIFLFEIHNLTETMIYELHSFIEEILNINIIEIVGNVINLEVERYREILLQYFTICKIIRNLEIYKNYLINSIKFINNNDLIYLSRYYFSCNDIQKEEIQDKDNLIDTDQKQTSKKYIKYYIFRTLDFDAIDNKTKCLCTGYILAFDECWNIFPQNGDPNFQISQEAINKYIDIIGYNEENGNYWNFKRNF